MRISTVLIATVFLLAGTDFGATSTGRAFFVVVHRKNKTTALDKKALTQVFLKKRTQWSDDSVILPVDQSKSSAVREQFSEEVLGRSVAAVRAYWNQLVFSGRGVPPPELGSDEEVLRYVGQHAGAIGYVSAASDVDAATNVKIVQVR
jgi:ABC-type phosphate transport system substrate-binding protein